MSRRGPMHGLPADLATGLLVLAGLGGGCHQVQDNVPAAVGKAGPGSAADAAVGRESHRVQQAPAPGGVPIPGTRVVVPPAVSPGEPIRIVAPAGSVVTFQGTDARVPASGVLLLDAPATSREARLAVERPDGRRLVFRIRIE